MSWFDDLISGVTGVPSQLPKDTCSGISDQAVATARQRVNVLAGNWKVQRLYYVADFASVLNATNKALGAALKQGDAAVDTLGGDTGGIKKQLGVLGDVVVDGMRFLGAYQSALLAGAKAVDSVDFKAWALNAAAQCAELQWWIQYTQCRQPAFTLGFNYFLDAIGVIIDVVRYVVEAVVDAVEDVYHLAKDVVGFWTYLKYGALVLGGAFAIHEGTKIYEARRLRGGGHHHAARDDADEEDG